MKIRKLFLKAFGPFTGATLDFSGPANLHLIYGANEAGKSSALRAITDLRYGIPRQSKDDFVHEFKDMLLAACFEDAAGRAIGLARRKGNKDPLAGADPDTGAPLAGVPVAPDVLLALTGGVTREQFETMYGLDSSHLRKGGQQLIQGEGDMGAALFEASTGSAGIKQLLQTLQTDARKYFIAKGQLPLLNEAARQLDDARQRYKLAGTRPEQWKALKRVHEDARGRLAALREQLSGERRRLADLTELRAVAPLLRELDLAEGQWAQMQSHVALPADSRERRLEALGAKTQAQAALAQADEAIAECRQSLLTLRIEPLLLNHAPVIDRLESDMSLLRREQGGRLKLEASSGHDAGQLMLQAERMTQAAGSHIDSLDEFFRQTLSSADQTEAEQSLQTFHALALDLQHAQVRLDAAGRKLALLRREVIDEPAQPLRQALSLALAQAQSLGDAQARQAGLQADIDTGQRNLDRCLADLGLASLAQLSNSRWLAATEIDGYEREGGELLAQAALNQSRLKQLRADLAAQQRRRGTLAATGEVVTADTLRQSRIARDEGWKAIRAVFIERQAKTGSGDVSGRRSDLPGEFEHLQGEADRQADLLREGARRAAEIAECEQRISEMTTALAALNDAKADNEKSLAVLDENWHRTLSRLGLPGGAAAAVREWLALRLAALDRAERLAQARQSHALLARQMADAGERLQSALQALGRMPAGATQPLDALINLGVAADRDSIAARAAVQRRSVDIAGLALEIEADQARTAALAHSLQACRKALDSYCRQLSLEPGAQADAIRMRLGELRRWANDYQAHVAQRQQLEQMKAGEAAAASAAMALGGLLQEPVWNHQDAWLDGLTLRLAQSREAAAAKASLERREADETARRQRAASALDDAQKLLEALVQQAGVQHADALPEAEARSDRRRDVAARLRDLKDQLDRTSPKNSGTLRKQLAGLDSVALDAEKQACQASMALLEAEENLAIDAEQAARVALAQIDTSDEAAQAREEMEAAIARYRAGVRPWAQLKLAEALLNEALRRHREKAQGPVVELAGDYFRLMTGGRFARLLIDDNGDAPVLLAQPVRGKPMGFAALSEGTADQLYLALRLAALQLQRRPDRMMPLVLDDVFITADDKRAAQMFRALEKFAAMAQVLVFTHHHHLLAIASAAVAGRALRIHRLESAFERNESEK